MIISDKLSLGQFLAEKRKEKGLSIDEIVRDTNIPKKYIEAIESDNFDIFPGETYVIGFISNYAEALEIDREEIINFYRRQKTLEEDSPVEQLIGKREKIKNSLQYVYLLIVAVIVIAILFFIIKYNIQSKKTEKPNKTSVYSFDISNYEKISFVKYRIGDKLIITNNTNNLEINFNKITNNFLIFALNNQEKFAKIAELIPIDFDNDGSNDYNLVVYNLKEKDIRISLNDIKLKETTNKVEITTTETLVDNVNIYNKYKDYIISETELMSVPTKIRVTLKIVCSGLGWIEYNLDGKEEKEVEISNGMNLSVSFNDYMLLSLGNSGVVKIVTEGKEEIGGSLGEVTKSLIYWKFSNNKYSLVRALLK